MFHTKYTRMAQLVTIAEMFAIIAMSMVGCAVMLCMM